MDDHDLTLYKEHNAEQYSASQATVSSQLVGDDKMGCEDDIFFYD